MNNKFHNKYRTTSTRLQKWDYGWNGIYFITICTQNRECFFGHIVETRFIASEKQNDFIASEKQNDFIASEKQNEFIASENHNGFIASEIGNLAHKYWMEIPHHYPFVQLDAFVVMPNHVHGILIINKPVETRFIASPNTDTDATNTCADAINPRTDAIYRVSNDAMNRVPAGGITGNKNPMLHDNISRIIRWYKGRVSFESRKIHADFAWQPRFHDHIIRNDESYKKISQYIINNPLKWNGDKFNPKNKEEKE